MSEMSVERERENIGVEIGGNIARLADYESLAASDLPLPATSYRARLTS